MPDVHDAEAARGPGLDSFRGSSRLERVLLPFLREPTLWPVFAVLLLHVLLVVAPLLVLGFRDASGWSLVTLVFFFGMSLVGLRVEVRDRGRPGLVAILVGIVWVSSAVCAWVCVRLELL